jgi:alpha-tubulin suppressor-like RCC1 family protein
MIKDIVGGENFTLILLNEGDVYGAGKNDEG